MCPGLVSQSTYVQYKLHTAHMYLKCYFGRLQVNTHKDMYAHGAESMASHALHVFLVLQF